MSVGLEPPTPQPTPPSFPLISTFLSFQRECFNQVNGGKLLHRFYSLPLFALTSALSIILKAGMYDNYEQLSYLYMQIDLGNDVTVYTFTMFFISLTFASK